MFNLIVTQKAKEDICEVLSYIKDELLNKKAASKLADLITEEFAILREFPLSSPIVNDPFLSKYKIRFLLIKNFKAFYIANEEKREITIVRFLYARRDAASILTKNLI